MALLSPPPKHQFFGDDGLPLSLGLVYTYEKDTTTPLATYTDSTGSVANANPIVLDNNGRASIWFQILPYSLVIYNNLGELQSCSGPVEFPQSTTSGSDIEAWSDIVVYNFPDLAAGSDGYTYRCVGTNVLDDDPVTSTSGDWVNLSSIASPTLTGTPTAPTAAAGTNTTQIATCAFVLTNFFQSIPGHRVRPKFTYVSGTGISIGKGKYEHSGTIQQIVNISSTISYTFSGISGTDWSYLYLDDSAIVSAGNSTITASQLTHSTTEPAWDEDKQGWYNGLDRCIFAVYHVAGAIKEFLHEDNLVIFADDIAISWTPTSSFTDAQLIVPIFTQKALVTFQCSVESDVTMYWRTNGQTGSAGHLVGRSYDYISNISDDTINTVSVITDSSGIIEAKYGSAIYSVGWFFSRGL